MPEAPLVGRTSELAALERLLDSARGGRGSLALVTGEAGLGKSRLLRELETRAREAGTTVLVGTAVEDGPAYRPIAQAILPVLRAQPPSSPELRPYRAGLGRLLPDWAEGTDERVDVDPALVLGEGVIRLLDDNGAGCLLVVEDAHWADPDSLALLEYLAGAVRNSRVLVAVSARDDMPGADVVRRLGSGRDTTTLTLAPLSAAETEALATARADGPLTPELAAYVVSRSEGLPLLAEELVVTGAVPAEGEVSSATAVPATFATEVQRRLGSLEPEARRAVQAASALGGRPDWSLLPVVTGQAPEVVWAGLRDAVAANLLVQDAAELRWRHALTRDAVAGALLAPERGALAGRAAEVLLDRGRPDDEEHAARLLLETGDTTTALEVVLRAAVRERRRAAYGSAERLLGLGESAGGSAALISERVLLLTLTGRPVAALEAGVPGLDRAIGDDHAELCLRLARAAIDDRRWADSEQYVVRAGRPDDPRSPTLAADAAHGDGRVAEAATLADRAVSLAETAEAPEQLCDALITQGRIARLSDLEAASRAFARAAQVAAEHGLSAARVEALLGLGTLEMLDADESATMRTARELALDLGLLSTALSADLILCDHQLLEHGPMSVRDGVRRLLDQAVVLRLHGLQAMGGILLGMAGAASGSVSEMEAALAEVASVPGLSPDLLALTDAARAHAPLMAHDLPAADALLDRAVPRLVENTATAPLHVIGLWALLRTVAGSAGDGGLAARDAVRAAPGAQRPANRAALGYADAVAAGRAGRGDDAAAAFAAADAVLRDSSWWRRVLRLLALERAVVDSWGDPVPELRHDLAEHEHAGEERLAGTCRDLLRRAGAPTRRGRGAGPVPSRLRAAGVTSRELDVLRLVRDGRSNAQIAERLFLSTRTVETHVAHLLAKSGTAGRSELAAWSRELGA